MKATTAITLAALAFTPILHGCAVGLVAPAVGVTNMLRNGPVQAKLEGKGDAIAAFKRAVITAGGSVPRQSVDFAEGQFSVKGVQAELQALGGGKYALNVTPTVAKSWDFVDTIAQVADAITDGMSKSGFVVVERKREAGL